MARVLFWVFVGVWAVELVLFALPRDAPAIERGMRRILRARAEQRASALLHALERNGVTMAPETSDLFKARLSVALARELMSNVVMAAGVFSLVLLYAWWLQIFGSNATEEEQGVLAVFGVAFVVSVLWTSPGGNRWLRRSDGFVPVAAARVLEVCVEPPREDRHETASRLQERLEQLARQLEAKVRAHWFHTSYEKQVREHLTAAAREVRRWRKLCLAGVDEARLEIARRTVRFLELFLAHDYAGLAAGYAGSVETRVRWWNRYAWLIKGVVLTVVVLGVAWLVKVLGIVAGSIPVIAFVLWWLLPRLGYGTRELQVWSGIFGGGLASDQEPSPANTEPRESTGDGQVAAG